MSLIPWQERQTKDVRIIVGEKYQSKYLVKEAASGEKKKPVGLIIVLVLVLVALLGAAVYFLTPGTRKDPDEKKWKLRYANIDAAIATLQFDAVCADGIQHRQVRENGVVIEVFSMPLEEREIELFRICFGDEKIGNKIGSLMADGQEIPVCVVTGAYTEADFPDRETRESYYLNMDQINTVIALIYGDSNFVEPGKRLEAEAEVQLAKMIYWDVQLPDYIVWEESTSEQGYQVDFFGTINSQTVHLYTISIAKDANGNVIGMYEINGKKLPVSVQTYSLKNQENLVTEEDATEYFTMVETIEEVIRAINEDEKFSKYE